MTSLPASTPITPTRIVVFVAAGALGWWLVVWAISRERPGLVAAVTGVVFMAVMVGVRLRGRAKGAS